MVHFFDLAELRKEETSLGWRQDIYIVDSHSEMPPRE